MSEQAITEVAQATLSFAVLGDSAAYGVGDLEIDGKPRGWAFHVWQHLEPQSENTYRSVNFENFSRPGAKSGEVLEVQLKKALQMKPDLCAVMVGGNDLLRNGFDPVVLERNLREVCMQLAEIGSQIIMLELHDPLQLLRLPKLLGRVLRRRVEAVNAVYRTLQPDFDIIIVRTRSIPQVHDKRNWHIDRMHPGPRGHRLIAADICSQLNERGWSVFIPEVFDEPLPSKAQRWFWLVRKGTPWFLKRSVDLLPAAIFLMAKELLVVVLEALSLEQAEIL